jgi:hypothetical protein
MIRFGKVTDAAVTRGIEAEIFLTNLPDCTEGPEITH